MSVLVDKNTRLIVQGFTGQRRHLPHPAVHRLRHQRGRRRRRPARAAPSTSTVPVFDTVSRRREGNRRQRHRDLRAAAVRGRRHHGSRRRRHPAGRLHHRRHPGARHGAKPGNSSRARNTRLIGPNCPGVITPGECKIGIMPGYIHMRGPRRRRLPLGHADLRSGRAAHQAAASASPPASASAATRSTAPTSSTSCELFNERPRDRRHHHDRRDRRQRRGEAAAYIKANVKKPVVGFIAGQTAPPGRRMGHAGAIISGGNGTASDKIKAMEEAGITVCHTPADLGVKVQSRIRVSNVRFPSSNPTPSQPASGNILALIRKERLQNPGRASSSSSAPHREGFYAVHKERPFFGDLIEFMTEGPIIVMALEREGAVEVARSHGRHRPRQRRRGYRPQALRRQHRPQLPPRQRQRRQRRHRTGLVLPRLRTAVSGIDAEFVGRTPWSARVPLDPLIPSF